MILLTQTVYAYKNKLLKTSELITIKPLNIAKIQAIDFAQLMKLLPLFNLEI